MHRVAGRHGRRIDGQCRAHQRRWAADLRRVGADHVGARHGRVDILVNNAANNPKMEPSAGAAWSRLENFDLAQWNADIAVGLTGAFLCAQVFGAEMARRGAGVILNVASDLAVIAPDQRLYRDPEKPADAAIDITPGGDE